MNLKDCKIDLPYMRQKVAPNIDFVVFCPGSKPEMCRRLFGILANWPPIAELGKIGV